MGWIERLRGIPMTGPEAFWRSGVAGADPAALAAASRKASASQGA